MGTLYATTGEVVEAHPQHGEVFTLAEAHALVGGYIEIAPRPVWATNLAFWRTHVVLVDEDGRLRPAAQENIVASRVCEQRLFGAVLVLTQQEWEATMSAPDAPDGHAPDEAYAPDEPDEAQHRADDGDDLESGGAYASGDTPL